MQELYAVTYCMNGQDSLTIDIPRNGFVFFITSGLATQSKSEAENLCTKMTQRFQDTTYKVVKLKIEECE